MAWVDMDVAPTQDGGEKESSFEKTIILAGAGDTASIMVPDDVQNVIVTAQAAGGATATIYTSTDLVSIVKSGSGITWIQWAAGAVTTATGGSFFPVTAIKMTQTGAGSSAISIRAQ